MLTTISIPLTRPEFTDLEFAYLQRGTFGDFGYLQTVRSMTREMQARRPGFRELEVRYRNQVKLF